MTLRITQIGSGPVSTLKLDGRLTAEELGEVRRVHEEVKERVFLDLIDLQFADRSGVRVLRKQRAQGAELTGASPYLRLLLDGR